MKYRAICFDIDGTLYPIRTMNLRLARRWVLHPFLARSYKAGRRELRRCQHTFRQDIPLRWREAMIIQSGSGTEPGEPFDKEKYRSVYEQLDRVLYKAMERQYRKTRPFDGVQETFRKIRNNGLKTGVFTDFPLFSKLQGMELDCLVDFAASSDDAGYLKPDTHCFEYLLYNLGMKPGEVLYVGDSYAKDIAGAAGAGMDAVLVNASRKEQSRAAEDYPLAKAVFCTWKEFDNWLMSAIVEGT